MGEYFIQTKRLILRQWNNEDLEPFAKMNADPLIRKYFASILTQAESDKIAKLFSSEIENLGYGFWALSAINVSNFIGFTGIKPVDFESHFTPAFEIGWRLAREYWGSGYATEAAKAALIYGFEHLDLDEVVSFTNIDNRRSRLVMERIGMKHTTIDDFDHPNLPIGHKLRKNVLYRLKKEDWKECNR